MVERFDVEVKWINPKLLVNEREYNKVESFFLGLSVIFNDIRGLITFEDLILKNFEKPKIDELNSHAGNYSGLLIQVQKLMVSTISEFFIFLRKHTDILGTTEYKKIFNRLPKNDQAVWNGVVAAAHGKLSKVEEFLSTIVKVRSNTAFHYDHSGKIFRNSYISKFFAKVKMINCEKAYYSLGNQKESRFYFADVAVQESLEIAAGKKFKEVDNECMKKYNSLLMESIIVINSLILSLLKNYISVCRNKPH